MNKRMVQVLRELELTKSWSLFIRTVRKMVKYDSVGRH